MNSLTKALLVAACGFGLSFAAASASAEDKEKPAPPAAGAHSEHGAKAGAAAVSATTAKLDAVLVEPEKKAQDKAATVKVTVSGIKIVDPATTGEKAMAGQGHLHYTVDDGPTVATTTTKLSFHGLSSGKHSIKVVLAGNDHSPLGPEETLEVNVP